MGSSKQLAGLVGPAIVDHSRQLWDVLPAGAPPRIRVGDAPAGMAVFGQGARLAVTNSNRFGDNTAPSLTIIDANKISNGKDAILASVAAGVIPRELRITENQRLK